MNYFRALPLKIFGWRGLEAVGLEKMAGISVKESIAQRIERLTTKIASLEDEGGESLDQLLEELSDISVCLLYTSDAADE